jgi:hypothetical protein
LRKHGRTVSRSLTQKGQQQQQQQQQQGFVQVLTAGGKIAVLELGRPREPKCGHHLVVQAIVAKV